jgi:hypothetical protein
LSQGELDVPIRRSNNPNNNCSFFALCCAYCGYACEYAPGCCSTLAFIALIIPTYFLIVAILNPTENFGVVKNDYTDIQSQYDLSIGKIDHWCLKGDNDSCRCEDPLQPQSRGEYREWSKAHSSNNEVVQQLIIQEKATPDIAFVGASIVEAMDGRWFGDQRDNQLDELKNLFESNFYPGKGAKLEGVALGIAGDIVSEYCSSRIG